MALLDDALPSLGSATDLLTLGGLLGADRFRALFDQSESDFKQFSDSPTDRRLWLGTRDKSAPDYFFLLKYNAKTVQIPFNVSPQREIVNHPHAMTIMHGQGGGKVVASEGVTSNDITIQGRCGLYPGKHGNKTGASGIGSGVEQLKFLETVFQRYCFLKRFGDASKGLQLVYVNRRLQDAWVVEPKTFTREDTVEQQNNMGYTITLEALYPYDGSDAKSLVELLLGAVPFFSTFDKIVQGLAETVDNLNAVIGEISAVVDGFSSIVMGDLTQLAVAVAQLKKGALPNKASFKKDVTKSLLLNLQATANALEQGGVAPGLVAACIKAEKWVKKVLLQDKLFEPSPQDQAQAIAAKQEAQAKNFDGPNGTKVSPDEAKAMGAQTKKPSPDELLAGASQGSASLAKIAQDQNQIAALEASNAALAAQLKTALDSVGAQQKNTVGGSIQSSQTGNFSMSSPSGSGSGGVLSSAPSKFSVKPPDFDALVSQAAWGATIKADLAAIDPANAEYKTATVAAGDDIQTLALKLLGDPGKWPQLVMLNNLQYPYVASADYIAANGLVNCLAYGDSIVYAVPKTTGLSRSQRFRNETDASLALSPFERALGNDILISEQTGDAVWGPDGDLQLTYGVQNLAQFIRKRTTLRKGILRRALRIGFTDFIGQSLVVPDVIKAEARGLFLDDDRIVSCEAVDVQQVDKRLLIFLRVVVRDLQDPIVVPVNMAA